METLWIALRIVGAIALWAIGFALLWRLVLFVLSRIARWPELRERYAITQPFSGAVWRSASAHLGPLWYASTLTLGGSPDGLYIAAQFPFHFDTSPVLIPWSEIQVRRERRLFQNVTVLAFERIPGLTLRLTGSGANWILGLAPPALRPPDGM
jgi:hypothetical protein